MTHDEYERRKQRLEKERQAGMELVDASYRFQLRALELVWAATGGDGAAIREAVMTPSSPEPAAPPPAAPPRPARRKPGELLGSVRAALDQVPEVFNRNDVCQALGYAPDRGSLYRILQELQEEGTLDVEDSGGGNVPTTYKKTRA
jgi:hypothetical protein